MVLKERTKEAEKETNRGKDICRTMGYISDEMSRSRLGARR